MRLLLIRHGLSSFNCDNRIQGRDDHSILTEKGLKQAQLTGTVLQNIAIKAIYSSPLKRAASTTKKIIESSGLETEPIFHDGLLEVELGPWSGLTADDIKNTFPEDFKIWKNNPHDLILQRKDGTKFRPIKDLMEQARDFLKELIKKHPEENEEAILIVAHNAILRCIIMNLLGQPKDSFRKLKINNASISILNLTHNKNKDFYAQIECLNNISHLEENFPIKSNKSRVLLVRHGETNWNKEGRFQGQIDIPLNKNGHIQAKAAGNYLKQVEINKAYSSSMLRPRETAEAIIMFHKNLKLFLEDELIEINHGLWEGKLETEITREWPSLLKTWKESPEKVTMPEGETIQQVWKRSVNCWNRICLELKQGETALVVAHDAVNKTILCNLLGLKNSDIWLIKQGNGGVTIIDISNNPNEPDVVTSLNLTSHIGGVIDETAAGAL